MKRKDKEHLSPHHDLTFFNLVVVFVFAIILVMLAMIAFTPDRVITFFLKPISGLFY